MKKLIVLFILLTFLGCNKPPEVIPPPGTVTVPPEVSKILQAALNTGCSVGKVYAAVDSYLPYIRPFVPANIMSTAVPILNTFHNALNLYMAAVITWSDTKTAPQDFDALKVNLLKVRDEAMPLIQQIIALATGKPKGVVEAAANTKAVVEAKAMFSCSIDEFKTMALQIKDLGPIT